MKYKRNILITGGCGFIGSHVVNYFVKKYPEYRIVNMDKLTYAANESNVEVSNCSNYKFVKTDICDFKKVLSCIKKYKIDGVIHLAAESHVDNSIKNPFEFVQTNVMGTVNLLHAIYTYWKEIGFDNKLFYHISTDEVYGDLEILNYDGFGDFNGWKTYGMTFFKETTKYNPHSPYSASKASSDHFVRAYHDTYGVPIIISNCSNNYGINQHHEKLIPLVIKNVHEKTYIPMYGAGENVRDWLHVSDHVHAIDLIFHKGMNGETYNIGGHNEWKNKDLIKLIIKLYDEIVGNDKSSEYLIVKVTDRLGHDKRYAIDSSKLQFELGWKPKINFEDGLREIIKKYLETHV